MALRFSTKGRYGIRAICRLAQLHGDGPVSIQTIAEHENIPIRYLEQIMAHLRREGIVKSTRGPSGGYKLNRPPDQLSLGELIQTLEGKTPVVWCVDADEESRCLREDVCITRDLWKKLNEWFQTIFNRISLQEIIDGKIDNIELEPLFKNQGRK
jgi:Rrf2 family protein